MPHEALVWLTDAGMLSDEALAPYARWLDASEHRRLERFVRSERRRQFLAGRILARQALAHVLDADPGGIRLEDRPGSAPVLASPAAPHAGFSISHSGRWVACAASASSQVGLDIESVDPTRDIDALAGQAFDGAQQAWLAARPPDARVHDFFDLWSTLEAQFKLGQLPGSQFRLSTPGLSIVLCAEQEILCRPRLELKRIPAVPGRAVDIGYHREQE